MSKLINCEDAYNSLTDYYHHTTEPQHKALREALERVPPAQPERKKAMWIWNENGMDWGLGAWCCSGCGTKAETWWATDKRYNPLMCSGGSFCGNCGADMRGECDEHNH